MAALLSTPLSKRAGDGVTLGDLAVFGSMLTRDIGRSLRDNLKSKLCCLPAKPVLGAMGGLKLAEDPHSFILTISRGTFDVHIM
jgi:hypothetical protein